MMLQIPGIHSFAIGRSRASACIIAQNHVIAAGFARSFSGFLRKKSFG